MACTCILVVDSGCAEITVLETFIQHELVSFQKLCARTHVYMALYICSCLMQYCTVLYCTVLFKCPFGGPHPTSVLLMLLGITSCMCARICTCT